MVVTLSGSRIFVRLLQLQNPISPMDFSLLSSAKVMLDRFSQSKKAVSPTDVTPAGTEMSVKLTHSQNAQPPTAVTVSGIA